VNVKANTGGHGKLYGSKNRITFVATGSGCPRVNLIGKIARFRDDYSDGIRINKSVTKLIF
jgi:hypothetical protein